MNVSNNSQCQTNVFTTTNVNLIMLEEMSGITNVSQNLFFGFNVSRKNCLSLNPVGVEILQSGPKWWTEGPAPALPG